MCLLILLAQTHLDSPLVVAANRDELFDRPSVAMTVHSDGPPRVIGGRDELAGGTWLAVNDAGVVAGLTNRPLAGRRDPAKRSRGELPLALAGHRSAAEAVDAFRREFRGSDFNPAWLLVGDRDAAFAIDITGPREPLVEQLPPGIYVIENRPLGVRSPKVDRVRHLLRGAEQLDGRDLAARLESVLRDHEVPVPLPDDGWVTAEIPADVKAACVHTERYGTRWSCIATVPADRRRPPTVRYTDGPSCQNEPQDATPLWSARVG